MSDTPNPLEGYAESAYLSMAAEHLATAEEEREKIADAVLEAGGREYTPQGGGYWLLFESAARLAELNARMAEVCGAYQDRQRWAQHRQRLMTGAEFDEFRAKLAEANGIAPAEANGIAPAALAQVGECGHRAACDCPLPAPKTEAEIADAIRKQLAADTAAHESVTLRPGVDDEPPAAGELWTFAEPDGAAGEYFWYRIDDRAPGMGGWLMVHHYAQVLRWQSEQGTKPIPYTWDEIADETYSAHLRRPTAEERARFYGPEPDPQPAGMEQHERTTTIPASPHKPICACCVEGLPEDTNIDPHATFCGRCSHLVDRHVCLVPERRVPPAQAWGNASRGGAAQWREG